jgi:hypothetical protein
LGVKRKREGRTLEEMKGDEKIEESLFFWGVFSNGMK